MDSKIAYWGLIAGIIICILGFSIDLILSWSGSYYGGIGGIAGKLAYAMISLGFFTAAFFSKESDVIRAAMMLVGAIMLRLF